MLKGLWVCYIKQNCVESTTGISNTGFVYHTTRSEWAA
jgi:hypothetical protein